MSSFSEENSSPQPQIQSSEISYFTNRSGLQLAYSISIRNSSDKRILVICQMWPPEIFIMCGFLHENLGINTFKFEFTGFGNSQGERSIAAFARDADDIDDAVKFLASKGLKAEGLIGQTKCATSVIIYSALYGQIKNIFALSARFHMNILPYFLQDIYDFLRQNKELVHMCLESQSKFTWEMIEEIISTDMKFYCERAQGNIFIIHGDADEVCPYSESLEFVKELKEKCKGHFRISADHYFIGVFDEIVEIVEKIMLDN
ncbi:unnamed protein product [Blepharisma stoltei]|uniref:Serine aminopeptidase S33 domain-containing protein n=1 Tax=Blepharisma stoltei TaxID=1481888 RepID=A0AAU9JTP3_9CILI|nr:unnamed protein product [Blepharisma stoltei]